MVLHTCTVCVFAKKVQMIRLIRALTCKATDVKVLPVVANPVQDDQTDLTNPTPAILLKGPADVLLRDLLGVEKPNIVMSKQFVFRWFEMF